MCKPEWRGNGTTFDVEAQGREEESIDPRLEAKGDRASGGFQQGSEVLSVCQEEFGGGLAAGSCDSWDALSDTAKSCPRRSQLAGEMQSV